MMIRPEKESEFPVIYDLVKTAFETAKVSNGDEQNFVNRLRASENYIPELAFVAEDNGVLAGHIMLTKTFITEGQRRHDLLLLAPIAVRLEDRKKGIGSALIAESFRVAKERGHTAVILVGDPAFYERFGFKTSISFGIKNANGIPDPYVMACELAPHALEGISGSVLFQK